MEHFPTREEPGGKVLGRSPNNSVEFLNPRGVEIMLILMSVQVETQYPRPASEAAEALGVAGQPG
jgi:hypothetical protein